MFHLAIHQGDKNTPDGDGDPFQTTLATASSPTAAKRVVVALGHVTGVEIQNDRDDIPHNRLVIRPIRTAPDHEDHG